jgi:hypothetical protein
MLIFHLNAVSLILLSIRKPLFIIINFLLQDQCQNSQLKKVYKVGEKVDSNDADEDKVVRGSDYVFLSLPCDSKKFAFNYETLLQRFNRGIFYKNKIKI